ncbi:MAG: carboxypeptidase-like regulatory domain-containing protein, partial [Prevotella sp.]|nr:carboxypeptidase-like regulatory domain-containing protein [Prevotella sp.]
MQKRLLILVALLLTTVLGAVAQVTTSSMAGKVTVEGSEEAVIGATILATHEPSGTRYTAVTNVNGLFTIQGMRTGGPYAVTVSYIGLETKMLKGITLQLGETYNLSVWLSENSTSLTEVVISGKASKFAAEKTGASTNITNDQIMTKPSISRSITDLVNYSPYSGGSMSFAGGSGRMTNYTIDGANFNNNFGLSSALPGGGNPISLDAID